MASNDSKSLQGFGFLTVVEDQQQGWLGGLLVLNAGSRPLEFHCTAPVKPSRAQEILYGPTLAPYICGEQIGVALAAKSNAEVAAFFTDAPAMMAVRPFVETPVAYVANEHPLPAEASTSDPPGQKFRLDPAHAAPASSHLAGSITFRTGEQRFQIDEKFADDQRAICELLSAGKLLDLDEPFQRIREAIEETQLRKR